MSEKRMLGRYEIVAEIGKGAMGVVYRATDPLLNREVAIKTVNMSSDPQEMAEYEARFYQEARAAGGLNHPNIVTIYDVGKSGNMAYMAMELLDGSELRTLMKPGEPVPYERAVEHAAQVAEGLAYAHGHGVVHRDIKPANIMILASGTAKIMDFGIARMRTAEVRTQTGVVLGSPRYMSPEQVAGRRAEPRSDIFSLGVILYEMLTGKPAFTGDDVTSVMFQILNVVPPAPSSINPGLPTILDFIVAKALAKAVDDRYQSAAELAADLRSSAKDGARLATGAAPPVRPVAMPTLDPEATEILAKTIPVERAADAEGPVVDTAPTLGLSKAFNSMDATLRLAARTGMAADALTSYPGGASPTSPSAIVAEMRRGPGWTAKDRMTFAVSVALATVVGAVIVFV